MPIAQGRRAQLALWLARSALGLTGLSALLALAAVAGYRLGWFDVTRAMHGVLPAAAAIGFLSLMLIAVRIIVVLRSDTAPGVVPALVAMIGAFAVLWAPVAHYRTVQAQPPLYDVSTDFDDPPVSPSVTVGVFDKPGAESQKRAFPDIMSITLALPPRAAFERALTVAKRVGWEIAAVLPEMGRIEARNTSFWFRFTDDIVIRVRSQGLGSRVDIRAIAHQPEPDVGVDVRRLRKFLALMTER